DVALPAIPPPAERVPARQASEAVGDVQDALRSHGQEPKSRPRRRKPAEVPGGPGEGVVHGTGDRARKEVEADPALLGLAPDLDRLEAGALFPQTGQEIGHRQEGIEAPRVERVERGLRHRRASRLRPGVGVHERTREKAPRACWSLRTYVRRAP